MRCGYGLGRGSVTQEADALLNRERPYSRNNKEESRMIAVIQKVRQYFSLLVQA